MHAFFEIHTLTSFSHMEITASVRKSSHQDRGPYYSHYLHSFLNLSPILLENKKLLWLMFPSAN